MALVASAGLALVLGACSLPATPMGQPSASEAPQSSTTPTPPTPTPATSDPGPTTVATTEPTPSPTPPTASEPAAAPGQAMRALRALPVKGRAPMTGYDRDLYGQAWADVDRNGCDTRNDVLRRDLDDAVIKPGTYGCLVLSGVLLDPYTGATIPFERGVGTSLEVQIDHVVALGDSWQKGAQGWSEARRTVFANDPLNLLAVDGPTNAQKGASDAASWLPPSKAYRCDYVARQIAVKRTYGLWVTRAEGDAMARVLSRCPGQKLPTR